MRSEAFQEKLVRTLILVFVLLALTLVVFSSPAQAGSRHDSRVSVGIHVGGSHGAVSVGYRSGHAHPDRHGHPVGYGHHGHRGHGHYRKVYRHHPRFVVPRSIHASYVASYRPYHAGRVWVTGHRHYHEVYDFPVWIDGVFVYQPHAYCNGGLYVAGDLAWNGGYARIRYGY